MAEKETVSLNGVLLCVHRRVLRILRLCLRLVLLYTLSGCQGNQTKIQIWCCVIYLVYNGRKITGLSSGGLGLPARAVITRTGSQPHKRGQTWSVGVQVPLQICSCKIQGSDK